MGFNSSYKDLIFDSCRLSETTKANLSLCMTDLSWLSHFRGLEFLCVYAPPVNRIHQYGKRLVGLSVIEQASDNSRSAIWIYLSESE